jgi:hypothetical protein
MRLAVKDMGTRMGLPVLGFISFGLVSVSKSYAACRKCTLSCIWSKNTWFLYKFNSEWLILTLFWYCWLILKSLPPKKNLFFWQILKSQNCNIFMWQVPDRSIWVILEVARLIVWSDWPPCFGVESATDYSRVWECCGRPCMYRMARGRLLSPRSVPWGGGGTLAF